jgi:hypothetical protein
MKTPNLDQISEELSQLTGATCFINPSEDNPMRYTLLTDSAALGGMRDVVRLKTKTFDAEFILDRLRMEDARKSNAKEKARAAADKIRRHINALDLKRTPTMTVNDYGLGIDNLFQDGRAAAVKLIDELGIEYKRLEYSPARWVTRIIF